MKKTLLILLAFLAVQFVSAQKYEMGVSYDRLYSDGFASHGPTAHLGIRYFGCFDFRIKATSGYQNYTIKERVFCGEKFLFEEKINGGFVQAGLAIQPVFYLCPRVAFVPNFEANFPIDWKEDFYYGYGVNIEFISFKGYRQRRCGECRSGNEMRLFFGASKIEGIVEESLFDGWKGTVGFIVAF